MLFYQNLDKIIFSRYQLFNCDELVIVSGYVGPHPIRQLGTLPIKSTVIYGMYGCDGIQQGLHNALVDENKKLTQTEERLAFLNRVLELNEFFDRPVRTLSLGQRMRADLGAALLHNPKVLYLDEPTIGLDLVVKDNIRKAIKEINEKYQTTVILTTHDIGDIEELCSRIIIIDEGKKIYDGSLEKLKDSFGTRRKVSMEVKKTSAVKNLNLAEKLGVESGDFDTELDAENSIFTISFDKHKIHVPQILAAVMEVSEVTDIKLQETELAEIVKEIYNRGNAEVKTENGGE